MDNTLWLAVSFLQGLLPPSLVSTIQYHLHDPSSPTQPLQRYLGQMLHTLSMQFYAVLAPAIDRIAAALASSPDAVLLIFAVFAAVAVIQIMAFIHRLIAFWTRMVMRLLFWGLVVGLGAVMYQRGLQTTLNDAMVIGSKLLGFAAGVKEVFMSEYRRYEDMEKVNKLRGGRGGGYKGYSGRGW